MPADLLHPIDQRVSTVEVRMAVLVVMCERLHNDVDKVLARLEEVRIDGSLPLGDLSGVYTQNHCHSREQQLRDQCYP